ncbi:hypothetical protein BBK14_26555 [Parafrankia soli]|uniref:Short-chain dehydrogenase n=1 Tax=Parafrankia soli TaxID=2599596 RepID=A0A1S1PEX2_9ACTN|nr:SDR family NAD(P)-dependent oxidoreductase [Parafrankia soli]OHV21473.1 hypothetical protein BBK14_26555 [Parafrankia soli]
MKTAVVTGAGGGLGRAITAELARRGFAVWATDVELGIAEPVVEGLGSECRAAVLDVTDASASRALADAIVAEHARVLAVNATGTINGTNAALAHMVPAGRGQVINVISLAGIVATPGQAVYAASKHAAMAFTLSTLFDLRRGGHRGINICAVCPSGVWTPLVGNRIDDPEAAASFTAPLLTADVIGRVVGRLTERPRPVTIVPRRRGPMMRFVDLFPRLSTPAVPTLMRDARRRQQRYKRLTKNGEWP